MFKSTTAVRAFHIDRFFISCLFWPLKRLFLYDAQKVQLANSEANISNSLTGSLGARNSQAPILSAQLAHCSNIAVTKGLVKSSSLLARLAFFKENIKRQFA